MSKSFKSKASNTLAAIDLLESVFTNVKDIKKAASDLDKKSKALDAKVAKVAKGKTLNNYVDELETEIQKKESDLDLITTEIHATKDIATDMMIEVEAAQKEVEKDKATAKAMLSHAESITAGAVAKDTRAKKVLANANAVLSTNNDVLAETREIKKAQAAKLAEIETKLSAFK